MSRTKACAPWYHLASPMPRGRGLTECGTCGPILLRCDGRPRRGLKGVPRRPRGSKTMFGEIFGARSQLPGLSVTYLPAYSSLHCLWCAYEIVGSSLAQKSVGVNTSYCTEEQWIKPPALSTVPDRTLIRRGPGRSGAPAGGASGLGRRGGPAGWPHSRPPTG